MFVLTCAGNLTVYTRHRSSSECWDMVMAVTSALNVLGHGTGIVELCLWPIRRRRADNLFQALNEFRQTDRDFTLEAVLQTDREVLNLIALALLTVNPEIVMVTTITTILNGPDAIFLLLPMSVEGRLPLPPPPPAVRSQL